MKTKIVILGVLLLISGLYFGFINPEIPEDFSNLLGIANISYHDEPILQKIVLRVHAFNYTTIPVNLPETFFLGENIHGWYKSDGALNFYVMNNQSYSEWMIGGTTNVYESAVAQSSFNFTLNIEKSDTYYVVFDNIASPDDKSVVFEILNKKSTVKTGQEIELLLQFITIIGLIMFLIGAKVGGKKTKDMQ